MGGARAQRALRALAIVAPLVGIIISVIALIVIRSHPAPFTSVYDSISLIGGSLVLAMALLIAWRAGDHAPNISMALPLGFVFLNDSMRIMLEQSGRVNTLPAQVILNFISFLAMAFFIRATQLFPRSLTAADLAASPTIWGKVRALRATLTLLLRPLAVWVLMVILTLVTIREDDMLLEELVTIFVMLIGLAYFYVSFRSGDTESRRKVLWFLEAVLLAVVLRIIVRALSAAIGHSLSPDLKFRINIGLVVLNDLILVVCIGLAIFRAGAVSPSLVVRKTVVYGATISALLFLFAAVEIFIVERLVEYFEVTDHIATAFLGAAFGLAFHPLKHRIEHFSHRFAPNDTAVGTCA